MSNNENNTKQTTVKRLQKELMKLQQKPETDVTITLVKENILNWQITIIGPKKSLYDAGVFKYSFIFPENYPFAPPEVYFFFLKYQVKSLQQVYHPSYSLDGNIWFSLIFNI